MFTFSTADEEAIKKAGENFKLQQQLTPTNTTAAHTSFFAGTNSLKHKKRSIFSDHQNSHKRVQAAQSCDNKTSENAEGGKMQDEMFKFSSIKNYAEVAKLGEGEDSP